MLTDRGRWLYNKTVLSNQASLTVATSVRREQAGLYTCEASNVQGTESVDVEVRVLHLPGCHLQRLAEEAGEVTLGCLLTAGDPTLCNFSWTGDMEDRTTEGTNYSVVRVKTSSYISQTNIICRVTNRVGWGECQISVSPSLAMIANTTVLPVAVPLVLSLVLTCLLIIFCLYKLRSSYCKYL